MIKSHFTFMKVHKFSSPIVFFSLPIYCMVITLYWNATICITDEKGKKYFWLFSLYCLIYLVKTYTGTHTKHLYN